MVDMDNTQATLEDRTWDVIQRLWTYEQQIFATLLWAVWISRNEHVFCDKIWSAQNVYRMARMNLDDYCKAAGRRSKPLRHLGDDKWKSLDHGKVKLNSNASCREGLGLGLGNVL